MSVSFSLPLLLDGAAVSALVVGGGHVALRKSRSLLEGGAAVHVLAPELLPELREIAASCSRLTLQRGVYDATLLGAATLVVAATDDPEVNASVARDARALGRLIIVADDPTAGNCVAPAVHRAGGLLIAVGAGGVPGAAVRIREELGDRFDQRYAAAVQDLAQLRRRLLGSSQRERWHAAVNALITDDFCESVEDGTFGERVAAWQ